MPKNAGRKQLLPIELSWWCCGRSHEIWVELGTFIRVRWFLKFRFGAGPKQLTVTCVDSLGLPSDDVTSDAATAYASDDETTATVDGNGAVSAVGVGATQIRVTNGDERPRCWRGEWRLLL